MHKLAVALSLAAFASPAFASRSVDISQLRQQIAVLQSKSDAEAAYAIDDLVLTQRLSQAPLAELEKSLPGEKSRQALRALADESQFLAPPASEIPQQPTPDFATQRAIMGRVVAYVSKTIPQLPNFIATRTTQRYEDQPLAQLLEGKVASYKPLHPVGTTSAEITYRDGREVIEPGSKTAGATPSDRGLGAWGTFGPILSTVLLDAANNKLSWLRWERGESGPLAVFAYSVPREKSHYEVTYCCVADSRQQPRTFHEFAAYQGQMAVNPTTGAILRLTVESTFRPEEPINRADLLVEYGPTEIGGKTYICPLRSIALSRARSLSQEQQEIMNTGAAIGDNLDSPWTAVVTGSTANSAVQTLLNDSTFSEYHVFRSETRIIAGADAGLPAPGTPPAGPAATMTKSVPPAPPASAEPTPPGAAPAPEAANAPAESASVAVPASRSAPPGGTPAPDAGANAEPELNATDVTTLPDVPAARQALPNTGFTLRMMSRLVEVPVGALDKKGQPVIDLKPDELEVYDNGREQRASFFSQAGAGKLTAPAQQRAPAGALNAEAVFTNANAGTPVAASVVKEADTTVLLIDSSNVAFPDLTNAKQEILRFLKTVPADERVGLYVLHAFGFQILLGPTEDHAQVAAKLAAWMPSAQDLLRAQHEEDRNRQNMDYVQHVTDLLDVNGSLPTGEGDAYFPVDPQLRSLGDAPARDALAALQGVGRHLGAIPGHKALVWVASDNVLADFSEKASDKERGDKGLDPLVLRARETLNEAHVSLYPLDVSQLEAGGVGANLENANVQVKPTTNVQVDLLSLPGGSDVQKEAAEEYQKSQRDINPGRVTATLQQDTHPIQEIFVQLGQATGGRALRRAGDIAGELNSIVADGRAEYLLSFTPDTPADGKYHTLTVKCLRKDVALHYRTGYLYSEEPATMKERFREAVWQPRDESEIGLTATMAREANAPAVRLNIAARDLTLAEQNGRWIDKVDVFLVVRDDSAQHAFIAGKRLGLALQPATLQRDMKDGLTIEEKLPKLPAGAILRLIVIDENSRRMGSVTVRTNG